MEPGQARPQAYEHLRCGSVTLAEKAKQQVCGADIVVTT